MRVSKIWIIFQLLFLTGFALAENWPQWRGPHGNGVSAETGLPTKWSAEDNIAWKAPLGGLGVSRNDIGERTVASPAISGGQIFIRTDEHLICVGEKPST